MTPRPTLGALLTRSADLIRGQAATFGVLTIWAFAPLAVIAVYVAVNGGVLTGANGIDFFDQYQYLAWIRDAGGHLLASDLWVTRGTAHDYLQPMYLISGLLWRLGLSVQLAYLIWKPVALLVLFVGFAAYVRRMLSARWAATSGLILALFYESPVSALANWTGHLSSAHRLQLILTTDNATSALNLWGFDHAAIAIGLAPVFLLGSERLLSGAALTAHLERRLTALVALAGLVVAWLYPWQAVTLLAIVGAVWLRRPTRRRLAVLVVPVAATVLPLIYGVALSRFDPWWSSFQAGLSAAGTEPWWALAASFAPLVLFAAAGCRRPRDDGEWMLVLWPVACAGVYLLVPQFPPHALAGVTLPLAVLAVRGWSRLAARRPRRPRPGRRARLRLAPGLAVAAIAAGCVPAAVLHAQGVGQSVQNTLIGALDRQQFSLTDEQAAAFAYLDQAPRRGGVLAPSALSMPIPGLTGRPVYAGHPAWQPRLHVATADAFFDPALRDPAGRLRRAILRGSGAVFVITDCGGPPGLPRALAPLARPVRRFGCLTVYERY